MARTPRVFCSHRSVDKPRVKAVAEQLAAAGIDPWLDEWEIYPGDDIVSKINTGLADSDAALIFFSKRTLESKWVEGEANTLTAQAIEEGKPVIPVMLDPDAPVPPLLRTRKRVNAEDIDTLLDAIHRRSRKPPIAPPPGARRERHLQITINEIASERFLIRAELDGQPVGAEQECQLDADFHFSYRNFVQTTLPGTSRLGPAAALQQRDRDLLRLGQALGKWLFPMPIHDTFVHLLSEAQGFGSSIELVIAATTPHLLAMPFEAARLPDGRIPALEPGVRLLRRHTGTNVEPVPPSQVPCGFW